MDASSLTKDDLPKLRNIPVFTADGEEVGHVGDAYYDEETERLQCVGIAADGIGFAKRVIPVAGATVTDEGLRLPYGREAISGSPDVDDVDDERYREVSDYYERQGAVTRKEEELAVGARNVEAGKVRLKKWVETEPVEMDVSLQRETARVEREPINQPVADADFGEEEVEVPLHAQEPVVQKETVAKERVSVGKDVEQERAKVRDEVRKERVDIEEDER